MKREREDVNKVESLGSSRHEVFRFGSVEDGCNWHLTVPVHAFSHGQVRAKKSFEVQ
jgi:hypothetical protein